MSQNLEAIGNALVGERAELYRDVISVFSQSTDDYLFIFDIEKDEICFFGSLIETYPIHTLPNGAVTREDLLAVVHPADRKALAEDIERIAGEFPEILGIHDMMVHNYGPSNLVASLHAEVDGDGDIYYLHDVIDNVERRIHSELGIYCTIHMDPIVTKDETICALRDFLTGIVGSVLPEVTVHDFRVVVGQTHTNLIFDIVLPFESKISPDKAMTLIKEAVFASRGDCYCVITVDRA